jgi:flagellar L-ring protein precursor FlgH
MDGIAHRIGDLITVRIAEAAQTQISAGTTTERASENEAGISALFGLEKGILAANPNLGDQIGMSASSSSTFDGEGTTSRSGILEAMLTCKVVDVLPNGNLVIWGWKQVKSNRETQYLVLTGQVRPRDIQIDNTVMSSLIAEAKIEYTGSGVVSDKQGPGIGQRLMDWVWPF